MITEARTTHLDGGEPQLVIGVAPLALGVKIAMGSNVNDMMKMFGEEEDVRRIIGERKAEDAYLSMFASYGWPCHQRCMDYESHRQSNAEIVRTLEEFLRVPTEFVSPGAYGVRRSAGPVRTSR